MWQQQQQQQEQETCRHNDIYCSCCLLSPLVHLQIASVVVVVVVIVSFYCISMANLTVASIGNGAATKHLSFMC